jgi:hypothetical protein
VVVPVAGVAPAVVSVVPVDGDGVAVLEESMPLVPVLTVSVVDPVDG